MMHIYTFLFRYCVASFALLLTACGGGSSTPPAKLVGVTISPTSVSIAVNTTASLNAIGTYSDGRTALITQQVTWTSASSVIASVGVNTGLVTGVSAGSGVPVIITPTLTGFALPTVKVTVSATGGISPFFDTLNFARYDHTASLVNIGAASKVIVVGGYGTTVSGSASLNALASVEMYTPASAVAASGVWAAVTPLNYARGDHTSVNLQDGRILVTGGTDSFSNMLPSTEIYDPALNKWTSDSNTGPNPGHIGRAYNTLTLLAHCPLPPNCPVLAVGGDSTSGTLASAELYTPASGVLGTWVPTVGAMATARNSHTATLLPPYGTHSQGQVLVVGGFNATNFGLSSAELYDPLAGTWSPAASLLTGVRYAHTATLLPADAAHPSGQVLVVGGYGVAQGNQTLATCELYDPATNTWTQTASLAVARTIHTAVLLPNGKVLVLGGLDAFGNALSSTELYTPPASGVLGTWTTTSNMGTGRDNFTGTLLPADTLHPNGSVLSAGGFGQINILDNSELYWW